eukprot:365218-Chlamydomonas_euryale.AAC.2
MASRVQRNPDVPSVRSCLTLPTSKVTCAMRRTPAACGCDNGSGANVQPPHHLLLKHHHHQQQQQRSARAAAAPVLAQQHLQQQQRHSCASASAAAAASAARKSVELSLGWLPPRMPTSGTTTYCATCGAQHCVDRGKPPPVPLQYPLCMITRSEGCPGCSL